MRPAVMVGIPCVEWTWTRAVITLLKLRACRPSATAGAAQRGSAYDGTKPGRLSGKLAADASGSYRQG